MTIFALDPSLTCSGFSYEVGGTVYTGTVRTRDLRGPERLDYIVDSVGKTLASIGGVSLVVIEGYAMGVTKGGRSFDIGELGGVLKHHFWGKGLDVLVVPPTVLKVFSAGKGNAKKPEVIAAVASIWGYDIRSHDEADAFVLMRLGQAYSSNRVRRTYDSKRRSSLDKCLLLVGKHCN